MNLNREIGAWGALMRKSENPEFVMACQDILALGSELDSRRGQLAEREGIARELAVTLNEVLIGDGSIWSTKVTNALVRFHAAEGE